MSGSEVPFTAYDATFERMQASGRTPEDAARLVVEDYLDGKPRLRGKKKISKAERDKAFWSSAVVGAVPIERWATEPFTLALVRYFSQDRVANVPLVSRLAQSLPDTVCYAVRRSGLVLRSTSPRRAELAGMAELAPEIAELCRVLEIFEAAHQLRITALEKSRARLSELTPFELILYASLHAFHTLVPRNVGGVVLDEGEEQPTDEEFWDALAALVSWKLATAPEKTLRVSEYDAAMSVAKHLSPLIFPSPSGHPPRHDLLAAFTQVIADQVELNAFLSRSAEAFCYDDAIRFVRHDRRLEIERINPALRAAWTRDGRKLDRLHFYWLYRAMDAFVSSEKAGKIIGRPENHEANQFAYIAAMRTHLRLTEVYGADETVTTDTGEQVHLFTALLSLELMSAFFLRDFLLVFAEHLEDSRDTLAALSRLAFFGLADEFQNRFPLTWSDRSEKIANIVGWTVRDDCPNGSPQMAAAILDFWTSDWGQLGTRMRDGGGGVQPGLFERPVLKLGSLLVQLPWVVGVQNNSSAAINNLRRLGARRDEARQETQRIEERLGQLFESRGFRIVLNWTPPPTDSEIPGEVDLVCARDGVLLVLELKSTYLRRSNRDAWLHSTTTLRKAGIQLRRKVAAVERALRDPSEFSEKLALKGMEDELHIHGWIVDTSIECDHQRFEGFLKVSLEEVLIALRDDSHLLDDPAGLLHGNLGEGDLPDVEGEPSKTLYPAGFSVARFLEVIEREEVWRGVDEHRAIVS
ncbi:hypothetical protein [Aromatoleum evansii]|uniref:hypothetical protein n=1 Tax=Aromatoleum evansii TaxID=59406 RepID=UPI00145CD289|nr:hypothetical protein [Aromatoleum evansii]NMG27819.1 hypothetical protein [Aromatoleum evansii]